jgi:3-oxoacid CoA-transferase subunit A
MIMLTGDTHGDFRRVGALCDKIQPTKDDVLVILGDAGISVTVVRQRRRDL